MANPLLCWLTVLALCQVGALACLENAVTLFAFVDRKVSRGWSCLAAVPKERLLKGSGAAVVEVVLMAADGFVEAMLQSGDVRDSDSVDMKSGRPSAKSLPMSWRRRLVWIGFGCDGGTVSALTDVHRFATRVVARSAVNDVKEFLVLQHLWLIPVPSYRRHQRLQATNHVI
ncbi:MAG: hypothetical protein M2R45_04636 [Verrucomicrobia subdivision 3 bacterium]|nr:hypothetical protein [Limisphaerales bacterium]MCS1417128.1 hypothetical protein [Limisphaerales bacterium]